MANGIYGIKSNVILLFSFLQGIFGATCNTGYRHLTRYSYCLRGCCTSYTTQYKCCTSSSYGSYSSSSYGSYSSSSYGSYSSNYYRLYMSTGSIAGIAVSVLIGVGILIAVIICCTCSKKRQGRIIRHGAPGGANVTVVSSSMMQQGGMQPAYNHNQYNNYNNQTRGPGFYPQPQPGQPIQQPLHPNNTTQAPGLPPSYSQIGQYPVSNQSCGPQPNPGAPPPAYLYTNPAGPQYPTSNPSQDGNGQSNLINVSPYPN